ncbi:hypothetical protein [Amniculibacterium aquaticum]|jgi:hypothetical protein|uniref:hypothetical protein n=1 Tax=Amniculibacterium aquaticum TaxID=2479858 RepID=UPI000F5A44C6|nr:hypothetical protein [Amniculibacterium aquaticum]
MRKLFLVAALGVAGLMSAKEQIVKNICMISSESVIESESMNTLLVEGHTWIAIDSGCGQQYFLDLNHYSDDVAGLKAFQDDIAFFSEQKCRGAQAAANQQSSSFV